MKSKKNRKTTNFFSNFLARYIFLLYLCTIKQEETTFLLKNKPGEVAEWSIAPVLKTDVLKGTGGSNPSLSAEINLQDIDFQSCRFFLCPKKCTKNAPSLAPTHSYGRFQIPHAPHFPFSHEIYNKVISVSKIPLVHFFRLSCKKNARKKGTTLVVPF